MPIFPWVTKLFLKTSDHIYARYSQPLPSAERLVQCKLISHRGQYDNRRVFENSIPAFDRIKNAGVWGIELDVRWTRDLHPVVFHDRDLYRLFRSRDPVCRLTLAEIKRSFPVIPSLREVVDRFGRAVHLMIEIKAEDYPDPEYQNLMLKKVLTPLQPRLDYHLLSLEPEIFGRFDFISSDICIPIAEINVRSLSEMAVRKNFRGLAGHFLLMTDAVVKRHLRNSQTVGTGFVNSANCMFRELNRGVTWVFSQNALKLQSVLDRQIKQSGAV